MTSLNNIHSLSHTKWNCKYHVVFAPKYRPLGPKKENPRPHRGMFMLFLQSWQSMAMEKIRFICTTDLLSEGG